MTFEELINQLPQRIQRHEQEPCLCCGSHREVMKNYELKIDVEEYDIRHNYETGKTTRAKHFRVYYQAGNKYIGEHTGLGKISIEEAISDLLKEPIVLSAIKRKSEQD